MFVKLMFMGVEWGRWVLDGVSLGVELDVCFNCVPGAGAPYPGAGAPYPGAGAVTIGIDKTPRKTTFEPGYTDFDTIFVHECMLYGDIYPQIGASNWCTHIVMMVDKLHFTQLTTVSWGWLGVSWGWLGVSWIANRNRVSSGRRSSSRSWGWGGVMILLELDGNVNQATTAGTSDDQQWDSDHWSVDQPG